MLTNPAKYDFIHKNSEQNNDILHMEIGKKKNFRGWATKVSIGKGLKYFGKGALMGGDNP